MSPHSLSAGNISLEDFQQVLRRYPEHVKAGLEELDEYRFETLPSEIASRWQVRDETPEDQPILLLSKGELVQLVTWKLKHGTFRPKLQQLVESNNEEVVHKLMQDLSVGDRSAREKMQLLTQLKGIGPATASLVLSTVAPTRYPFFSDELFRWIHWDGKNADDTNAGIKSGKGWSRPIGYTQKEYDSLISRCEQVQQRLSTEDDKKLSFLDLERVAYVLGKEKVEIDSASISTEKLKEKRGIEHVEAQAKEEKPKRSKTAKEMPVESQAQTAKTRRKK